MKIDTLVESPSPTHKKGRKMRRAFLQGTQALKSPPTHKKRGEIEKKSFLMRGGGRDFFLINGRFIVEIHQFFPFLLLPPFSSRARAKGEVKMTPLLRPYHFGKRALLCHIPKSGAE